MDGPCCTQRGHYSTSTCYLCFSCFCFSVSGFPSLDCWWTAAWRHSRARLLQANKQHRAHKSWCLWGQIYTHWLKMPSQEQQDCINITAWNQWKHTVKSCRHVFYEFCTIFPYSIFSASAWTMMSSWTRINPTSKPQQRERRGLHECNESLHIWMHLPHIIYYCMMRKGK